MALLWTLSPHPIHVVLQASKPFLLISQPFFSHSVALLCSFKLCVPSAPSVLSFLFSSSVHVKFAFHTSPADGTQKSRKGHSWPCSKHSRALGSFTEPAFVLRGTVFPAQSSWSYLLPSVRDQGANRDNNIRKAGTFRWGPFICRGPCSKHSLSDITCDGVFFSCSYTQQNTIYLNKQNQCMQNQCIHFW